MERPQLRGIQEGILLPDVAFRPVALWGGRCCGVLAGAAAGLQLLVMAESFHDPGMNAQSPSYHAVVVYLLWASVGAWVPQQMIIALVRGGLARFWAHRVPAYEPRFYLLAGRDDLAMNWMIVGSLIGAAGAIQLLLIPLVGGIIGFNAFLQAHFLWMPLTWGVTQLILVTALLAVPGMLVGVTITAILAALRLPGYKSPPWAFTLLLAGSALGVGLWSWIGPIWAGRSAAYLIPALTYFAASVLCFLVSGLEPKNAQATPGVRIDPPDYISRDRYLVGIGLVLWATICSLWIVSARPTHDQSAGILLTSPLVFAVWILLAGLAGEGWMARRRYSRGGAGIAFWAVGLANVLGASVGVPTSFGSATGPTMQPVILPTAVQMTAWAVTGFTLPYLVRCLMLRHSSAAFGQSLALTFLFAGAGCGASLNWLAVMMGGSIPRMMVLLSLAAVAVGGTLVIHEPQSSGRRRRIRLSLVFASIGLVMVLFQTGWFG